jgi:hypothetical protein
LAIVESFFAHSALKRHYGSYAIFQANADLIMSSARDPGEDDEVSDADDDTDDGLWGFDPADISDPEEDLYDRDWDK